jgi:hypothetical protein
MMAFAFLQHLRNAEKKTTRRSGPPPEPSLPEIRRRLIQRLAAP